MKLKSRLLTVANVARLKNNPVPPAAMAIRRSAIAELQCRRQRDRQHQSHEQRETKQQYNAHSASRLRPIAHIKPNEPARNSNTDISGLLAKSMPRSHLHAYNCSQRSWQHRQRQQQVSIAQTHGYVRPCAIEPEYISLIRVSINRPPCWLKLN